MDFQFLTLVTHRFPLPGANPGATNHRRRFQLDVYGFPPARE